MENYFCEVSSYINFLGLSLIDTAYFMWNINEDNLSTIVEVNDGSVQ